jgi:DNA-binding MarR family transcriptional regulator
MKPHLWRDAIRDSELDRSARLCAFVLSSYMNGAGDTFVGKELVGKGAGLVVRAVDEAINRLEAAGYVTVIRSKGGRPNHYLAATPHGHAGLTPHEDAGSANGNPAYRSTEPRISAQGTPHGDAPESEEQSDESELLTRAEARDKEKRAPKARSRKTKSDPWEGEDLSVYDRA